MLTWDYVKSFALEHLEKAKVEPQREINARCPFCGDSKISPKKKRFWLKWKEDRLPYFHCFNCDVSGNFYKLYSHLKKVTEEQAKLDLASFDMIRRRLGPPTSPPLILESPKEEIFYDHILDDCVSEISSETGYMIPQAKRSLKKFRTDRLIPEDIKLFICCSGKYTGRIIIPIYNEAGRVIYFQARSLAKNPARKYLNPPADKNLKLNLSAFKSPIIITEGLIDSFMLPGHGIPNLGTSTDDNSLKELTSRFDKVIIAFDNDPAGVKALKKLLKDSKYASKLHYFLMPKEYCTITDLNELKTKIININILKFVEENSHTKMKTEVMLKLDMWRTVE